MAPVDNQTADSEALSVFVQGRNSNINKNHNPDKPLAADIPFLQISEEDCFREVRHAIENIDPPQYHTNWWTSGTTTIGTKTAAKEDPGGGHQHSTTMIKVRLQIRSSGETLTLACETGLIVQELQNYIAFKVNAPPETITFVCKGGCSWRTMLTYEQVVSKMFVNGAKSFRRQRQEYKYPIAIIGAGHIGLKQAMIFLKKKDSNFVVFDRMSRVGGTSWMYQANTTSKLQTEYGSYHLEWDFDNPIPTMFNSPWPSRNKLLEHFDAVAKEYGIMPHVQLQTNVKQMDMLMHDGIRTKKLDNTKWWSIDKYQLTLNRVDIGQLYHGKFTPSAMSDEDRIFDSAGIMFYPGNLTIPREETYKNEDQFEGQIGYGMFDEVDYGMVPGKDCVIVGHGAFAVENVRTCCEYGAYKCYMLCRRKNIACPRVTSWMANRSLTPLSCVEFLNFMKPMYDLLGWDVWSYYAVQCNEKRTTCMINQKARFGIGDIYFLSQYMGKLEVIVDAGVKRVSKDVVHLDSGRKLENVSVILKLLGFVGEVENDRLMGTNALVGFWVNDDPRRYLVAEPISVMANNMGGTSLSPGAYSWSTMGAFAIHYPNDYVYGVSAAGMLPKHEADYSDESSIRPAYVVDARHGTTTGMAFGMHTPLYGQESQYDGHLKAMKHRLCHPIDKFIAAAKEDWDYYAKRFLSEGFGVDKPYPDYPYTVEDARRMIKEHNATANEEMLPCDYEDLLKAPQKRALK